MCQKFRVLLFCLLMLALVPCSVSSDEQQTPTTKKPASKIVPLNKQETVLLDKTGNRLLIKSKVVLRSGPLEMLLCLKQTKEHESILSVDTKASIIHAGLLVLQAKPGKPVQYLPKYQAATGQKIDVFLQWKDKAGKPHRVPAQKWVRHYIHRLFFVDLASLPDGVQIPKQGKLRYDSENGELSFFGPMSKATRDDWLARSKDAKYQAAIQKLFDKGKIEVMTAHWVFAGSGYTKENYYLAEDGDVICVANFPTALLDLAAKSSSQGSNNLLYEAYTEHIPPRGTEVTIELIPVKPKAAGK